MKKENLFMFILFSVGAGLALFTEKVDIKTLDHAIAIFLFLLFSVSYNHLTISAKRGSLDLNYAINYGLSIALFTGPLGLLIYEILYNVILFIWNKWKNPNYNKPALFTFYNITTFTIANIVSYYLYVLLWPYFSEIPFGFWMLFALLVVASTFISDTIILIYFCIIKEIRTLKATIDFYRYWNILDHGKTGLTNGLLFVFLLERQWEFLIGLFLLNYLVNRSIIFKTQNLQDRLERDMFEEMAYTDALTGVNNRAFMDKKMKELSVPGETIGVVVADIDRFKLINDTYNHAVGDEVLKHFAKFLSNSLYKNDFIFRSGGEEFTLLLRGKTYEEACSLLEQIRQELEQSVVIVGFNGEDQEIKYTSSFGMFYKHFTGTASIEKGYIYADNLLFKSKRKGRNRITSENDLDKSESSQKDAIH